MRRLLLVAATVAVVGACALRPSERARPSVRDDANLFVYLRGSKDDVSRLSYRFSAVAAVGHDGARVPLELRLGEVRRGDGTRGRLLARGVVPAGEYAGIEFAIENAALDRPDGRAELKILDPMTASDLAFRVVRGEAVVLYATLDARASVSPEFGIAPSFRVRRPDRLAPGRVGWVVGGESGAAVAFDKREGEVVAVVRPGSPVGAVAVDSAAGRSYVTLTDSDSVATIDLLSFEAIEAVRLVGGDGPGAVALSPDREHLVTVNRVSGTVTVLDPETLVDRERLVAGDEPVYVLIDRSSRRAFVANRESNTVSVIDLLARQVVATVVVESEPFRLALDRSQRRLYVAHGGAPQLDVVDLESYAIERRVYVGPGVTALAVDRGTDLIYVGKGPDRVVEIYDPGSLLPVDDLRTDGRPTVIAIDDDEDVLFIGLADPPGLVAVPRVGKEPAYRIELEDEPKWLAIAGER